MRNVVKSMVVVSAFLVPEWAQAGMSYAPDTGTVARSRGGAFTARADDPMAIVYNPAGFADQGEMQVLVDVTTLKLFNTFDRADEDCPPDAQRCDKVSNTGAPKVSPNLIFSMPVGEALVAHAGFYGAIGVNYAYPEDGPQRFTSVSLVPQQLSYTTGVSWRPHPMFAVGITAGGMYLTNEATVVSSANLDPEVSESPENDALATLSVSQLFAPTGNIGFKVTPMENVEVGLSYRPPTSTNMGGTYSSASLPEPEKVHLRVNLPQILRTGVRYVTPGWDVELDLVVEDWTGRKKDVVAIDDGDLNGYSEIEIARNGKMAFSARLGGSYRLSQALVLHSGLLHETPAVPTEILNAGLVDMPKTGLNFGASYTIGTKYTVSGNMNYTQLQTTTVTNSQVKQRRGLNLSQETHPTSTVGNGVYEGYYAMMGVAFLAKF